MGIATGVVMCFIVFMLSSATTNKDDAAAQNDALKGEYISTEIAERLISDYSSKWVSGNELPSNTTIGGIIGRANIASLASMSNEEYIKFRFYYTQDENDAPQIGLIFYPSEGSSAVLRTGSASFCPTVCVNPN